VSAAPGLGYGLGIFSADTPCGTIWGHDGGIPGYVSIAYNNAEGTRSAVVLMPTQPDSAIVPKFESVVLAAVCSMFQRPVPVAAAAAGRAPAAAAAGPAPARASSSWLSVRAGLHLSG
jgi:D-alanyl-D-alanine carboxypeptidase